jgi:hypothetical protein
MSYRIVIVVESEELAKTVFADAVEKDSMCLRLVNGDEIEFGIESIGIAPC